MYKLLKRLLRVVIILTLLLVTGTVLFRQSVKIKDPLVVNPFESGASKIYAGSDLYLFEDSWLRKNREGLWEMYVTGSPFELGYKNGILTDSLNALQEHYFVEGIRQLIPSDSYLKFLKSFLAWYNRNLDEYIPAEYREEIYGVSRFASDKYSFIGEAYPRMLNYHAAHDIGHALQNMNLVACTAFMVKGEKTEDGSMLIGRNMDFSMGDDFARNKIIAFYRPDSGNNFAFITWAGMIGVVSGMNDKGLTITLNAANSAIPTSARTPVSILARKVLQYASNIQEAYEIIDEADVFVAECFLVASATDGKAVVVEKSVDDCTIYDSGSDVLVLTNHYQSDKLASSKLNKEALVDGSSPYRHARTLQLIDSIAVHTPQTVASVLRDQRGMDGVDIGMCNEKAVNQLIAHHSVIFRPERLEMWVSANPYQLGAYICYNLNDIFTGTPVPGVAIDDSTAIIEADPFLFSKGYEDFLKYKDVLAKLKWQLKNDDAEGISEGDIQLLVNLNPEFFHAWFIAGECWLLKGELQKAELCYRKALEKEVARKSEKEQLESRLSDLFGASY
jgi:isopenicillin-N N-acyltransferase-like protein